MSNVAYSNARAKSLENYLLGEERINRMIDSDKPDDALKILSEVNFGEGTTISSALDFEKLISAEKKKLFDFIKETCASPALADFIMLKSDFHNAEAIIKSKYLKIEIDDILDVSGKFDIDKMKEKIFEDDYSSFPDELAKALSFSDVEFVEGRASGVKIASVFSKAYFSELYRLAKKDSILLELYRVKADVANVGIALRLRDFSQAKEHFVEIGKITLQDLQALSEEQLELLVEKFKFSYISELISSAIYSVKNSEPLSDFEKSADSFAVNRMLKQKYATDGIFPFMQYCFYKLADLSNVRIVMVGLINGLNKSDIRNRLRAYYER